MAGDLGSLSPQGLVEWLEGATADCPLIEQDHVGVPVPGDMAEQIVQSAGSHLATILEFPIDLIESGQKGRHILHFFLHVGQLEESMSRSLCLATFLLRSCYLLRSRVQDASKYTVYTKLVKTGDLQRYD